MSPSRGHVIRLLAMVVFAGSGMPAAGETLYIGKLAAYANPARVREEVRVECQPEAQLPVVMREEILKRTSIRNVVLTDDLSGKNAGLAMEISILSLKTPPAASWTTEKRLMGAKTVVYRNGEVAAEVVRYSDTRGGGSLFRKVLKNRSTCQIVERLALDISEHTVNRLKAMKLLQDVPPRATE